MVSNDFLKDSIGFPSPAAPGGSWRTLNLAESRRAASQARGSLLAALGGLRRCFLLAFRARGSLLAALCGLSAFARRAAGRPRAASRLRGVGFHGILNGFSWIPWDSQWILEQSQWDFIDFQ